MNQVITGGYAPGQGEPWSRDFLRVVSWNINRGLKFSGILSFLRDAAADLILLQEVDLDARRTHRLDIGRELAHSLRLNYVFGKEFVELSQGSQSSPAYHGAATFSPWPLTAGRTIRFRQQSSYWRPHWYIPQLDVFQRRLGGRLALASEATIYGRRVATHNLHLESKAGDEIRLAQLREVLEDGARQQESGLAIIGGDFNLDTGRSGADAMLNGAGFHDAVRSPGRPTVPRALFEKGKAIDWIYVSGATGSHGRVHDRIRASDHYPVSTEFPLSDGLRARLQGRRK
ncbi:MAG: endonuclease/exonuclease/phosphatase family protein [Candidatus Solibacter sp.]